MGTVASFRAEDRDLFEAVRDGRKRVEVRAATPRFAAVTPDVTLTLVCGGDSFQKKVLKVTRFDSLDALLESHAVSEMMPGVDLDGFRKRIKQFPGYAEKIARDGLIAFELGESG